MVWSSSGSRDAGGLLPTASVNLHIRRLSGGVNWGVTEVLSAVTCQGPRILLDVLSPRSGDRSECWL